MSSNVGASNENLMERTLQKLFESEKTKMRKKWEENFLDKPWKIIKLSLFHRHNRRDVKNIDEVKDLVFSKLGSMVPFIFLNGFYGRKDHVGNIRNAEKGLLILYRLLSGFSVPEMERFLPHSSYADIETELFEKNGPELNSWLNEMQDNYFTTPKLRTLGARLNNPEEWKDVTCFLDGHDSRLNYNSMKEIDMYRMERGELFSYKFKKSGGRTQLLYDVNGFYWKLSDTEKAGTCNDGSMFERFKPDQFLTKTDVLMLDGGYTQYVEKVIEAAEERGTRLSLLNFCNPLRKINGIDFLEDESIYNARFGSMRSSIETAFAVLGNTFLKFAPRAQHRISNFKHFNLKLKLCTILLNCKHAVEFFNLPLKSHHTMWRNNKWDFPEEDNFFQEERSKREKKIQDSKLILLIDILDNG